MTGDATTCDAYNDAGNDVCEAPSTQRVADFEHGGDYPVCARHYAREVAYQDAQAAGDYS